MTHRNPASSLTPWIVAAAAFAATLSLLAARDRVESTTRVASEPATPMALYLVPAG